MLSKYLVFSKNYLLICYRTLASSESSRKEHIPQHPTYPRHARPKYPGQAPFTSRQRAKTMFMSGCPCPMYTWTMRKWQLLNPHTLSPQSEKGKNKYYYYYNKINSVKNLLLNMLYFIKYIILWNGRIQGIFYPKYLVQRSLNNRLKKLQKKSKIRQQPKKLYRYYI